LAGRKLRCKACQATTVVPPAPVNPGQVFQATAFQDSALPTASNHAAVAVIEEPGSGARAPRPKRGSKKARRERGHRWKVIALAGSAAAGLLVVTFLIIWAVSALGKWADFESKETNFRVSTPGPMKEETPAELKAIDASARMYATEKSESEVFGVTVVNIPEPRLASTSIVRILNDSCDGALSRARGGTQRYRQRLRRGPFEGMECVIDVEINGVRKGTAVIQTYLVKGRGYSLLTAGKEVEPHSDRAGRFFESFAVTDEPAFKGRIRRIGPRRMPERPGNANSPNEMQFLTKLPMLASAVFAPSSRALFTLSETGTLLHYTYPGFKEVGRYRLANGAHRSALDERAGRLYVASNRTTPAAQALDSTRQIGFGDIQIYDLKPLLRNPRNDEARLQPSSTIAVGGKISHLLLAPDGKSLYYLDVNDPAKPRLGVIDTALQRETRTIPIAANTEVICLAPNGSQLYAAATLCGHKYMHPIGTRVEGLIQVIEPASGKTRLSFKIPEDPFDMVVTADECVVVTNGSNQSRPLVVVDLKDEGGPIIEQIGGVYMASYVRLSSNGKRLFVADTQLSPPTTSIWDMEALARLELKGCGAARGTEKQPAGGDFYLSPDGKCLVCRSGAVYWVTKAEPLPRLEGK
jgi:hypothetical protein